VECARLRGMDPKLVNVTDGMRRAHRGLGTALLRDAFL
jgi:hypothetical protein